MPKRSAGILLYRIHAGELQVLLIHPGGPFWKNRDAGAWSIPKGEIEPGEDPESAARREFREETGQPLAASTLIPLPPVRNKSGKTILAFAAEGDFDPATLQSNITRMELPANSGRYITFPEADRAQWFTITEAMDKIHEAQRPLIRQLQQTTRKIA